jgi:hypothetical protein
MADIASELASRSGISVEQARKGLGVVLGLLKSKLPADSYAKVSAAVPGADGMVADAPDSGGVLGAVKGAVGKIFGGDALISKIGQLGLSAEQIQRFIPQVMEFLKGKVPGNVMNQIGELLPAPQEAAH